MARSRKPLSVTELVGMNLSDPEIALLPGQARELENIDLFDSGLGQKRAGYENVPTAGTEPQGIANSAVVALYKHSPNGTDATAEVWAARTTGGTTTLSSTIHRWVGGTWVTHTLPDVPDGNTEISFATFNGKLFIAYNSSVNRLHVFDGAVIRRVGMAPPAAAPVLASAGAGALGFTRFYRVRFVSNNGPRISEPGPSASITIAASSGVNVTRPAQVDGDESSWIPEAANAVNGPWFQLSNPIAIGTLVFLDASATIPTTLPSHEAGTFTLPPSCKYLSVYKQQLLMAGAWETSSIAGQTVPKVNRVWFTRPLQTLDISDDESVPTMATLKFWTDLSDDGDQIFGLSYPLEGVPYAFKSRQVWPLVATDKAEVPFRALRLTDAVGCSAYRTICIGEDENGNPALYFNSLRGPYRLGRSGLQYICRDFDSVGGSPRDANIACWFADLRQVYFAQQTETQYFAFNVRYGRPTGGDVRNGWTRHVLAGIRQIMALASFHPDFTAPLSGAVRQQPIIGGFNNVPSTASMLIQRDSALQQDEGENYRARILSGSYTLGDLLYNVKLFPPRVYAQIAIATSSFNLTCVVTTNFLGPPHEAATMTDTVAMGLQGLTLVSIATFEAIQWSDAEVWRFEIGDASALNQAWRLNALFVPYQIAQENE